MVENKLIYFSKILTSFIQTWNSHTKHLSVDFSDRCVSLQDGGIFTDMHIQSADGQRFLQMGNGSYKSADGQRFLQMVNGSYKSADGQRFLHYKSSHPSRIKIEN